MFTFYDNPMVVWDTLISLRSLRDYLSLTETQMEESYKKEEAPYREALRKSTNDDEVLDVLSDKQLVDDHYEQQMKPILRYSLVVFIHIVFETRLGELCDLIAVEEKLPLRSSELQGSPVEQAKRFFGKLAGVEISQIPEWQKLKEAQAVRNCIVHRNGFLDEDNRLKLAPVFKRPDSGLAEDENGRLIIEKRFCEDYIATLERFFRSLILSLGYGLPPSS